MGNGPSTPAECGLMVTKKISKCSNGRLNLNRDLNWKSVGPDGWRAAFATVKQEGKGRVHTLLLESNYLESEGARLIAEEVQLCPFIHTLVFRGNTHLKEEGVRVLLEGLGASSGVRTLNISRTALKGAAGGAVVGEWLAQQPHLQELYLNGNNLGFLGVKVLLGGREGGCCRCHHYHHRPPPPLGALGGPWRGAVAW
jgi:hypothetical protein